MVASVVSAASAAGARRVVVVGPPRPELALTAGDLRVVREDPPGSGPVPAVRTGLAEVSAPWVLVLAADLPFVRATHLGALLTAAQAVGSSGPAGLDAGSAGLDAGSSGLDAGSSGLDAGSSGLDAGSYHQPAGAVFADDTGRPQWLAGCWPTLTLRRAIGGYRGSSLHGLLRPLRPVILGPALDQAGPPPWLDCDTEEDVRLARAWSNVPADSEGGVPR